MPRAPSTLSLCRAIALAAMGLSLLGGVAATGPATAPATQPGLSAADLQMLHRLETGTWKQRQSVQQELAGRGIADAPVVAAMLARTTNPEAQTRLHAVLTEMDADRQMGTSLITLHYQSAPAKTVYADLFRQAWAPLNCTPSNLLDTLPAVSIDVDRQPFWTVIQRLGDTTQVGMTRPIGGCTLCRGKSIAAGRQFISGAFLGVLSGVQPFAVSDNTGAFEKYFELDLFVYPEPKLDIQQIDQRVAVRQASDDHGNVLQLRDQQAGVVTNSPPGGYTVALVMKIPKNNPGTRLVGLRATLRASIALQSARFDIADPTGAKPQSIDVDGLMLKFDGCKKTNGRFYQASFSTGPDPANRFQQIMQSTGGMRMFDAGGRDMSCFQSMTSDNPTVGCSMSYSFGAQVGDVAPKRLVWEIPIVVKTVSIPVDFRDVNRDINSLAQPPAPR